VREAPPATRWPSAQGVRPGADPGLKMPEGTAVDGPSSSDPGLLPVMAARPAPPKSDLRVGQRLSGAGQGLCRAVQRAPARSRRCRTLRRRRPAGSAATGRCARSSGAQAKAGLAVELRPRTGLSVCPTMASRRRRRLGGGMRRSPRSRGQGDGRDFSPTARVAREIGRLQIGEAGTGT